MWYSLRYTFIMDVADKQLCYITPMFTVQPVMEQGKGLYHTGGLPTPGQGAGCNIGWVTTGASGPTSAGL